ncbi:hypothetical protein HanPI659440_Chr09g0316231 [Helianthus annuus]|nr:hypothetical protein HanLR1_Chr09g0299031 [Helianthus annuus]KAJ0709909.1 hypothetical protein HanOQP8_Chr09g0305991 [Helianthus annuus]KAJ0751731.1 hypothetical protein HanPI659440_Chr09g0316231 [Helianthus annuus]
MMGFGVATIRWFFELLKVYFEFVLRGCWKEGKSIKVAWIESCVEKILLGMRAMVLVRLLVRQGPGLFDPFC